MNLNAEIDARIRTFVAELNTLVRKAALDSVQQALGGSNGSAVARSRRPSGDQVERVAALRLPRVKKGQKRDPRDLAKVVAAVRSHVAAHPGEGVETIAKHLGVSTKALALPIKRLLAEKSISRRGQKRATRYFPKG